MKKIEFQNSIRRLSFLCRLPDIKIAWVNPHWDYQGVRNISFSENFDFAMFSGGPKGNIEKKRVNISLDLGIYMTREQKLAKLCKSRF